MEINGVDVENMTNDEFNSLIKKMYQSRSQELGGKRSKISIRSLSSTEDAFDKNGKYYNYLRIPLMDNMYYIGDYHILFQKKYY